MSGADSDKAFKDFIKTMMAVIIFVAIAGALFFALVSAIANTTVPMILLLPVVLSVAIFALAYKYNVLQKHGKRILSYFIVLSFILSATMIITTNAQAQTITGYDNFEDGNWNNGLLEWVNAGGSFTPNVDSTNPYNGSYSLNVSTTPDGYSVLQVFPFTQMNTIDTQQDAQGSFNLYVDTLPQDQYKSVYMTCDQYGSTSGAVFAIVNNGTTGHLELIQFCKTTGVPLWIEKIGVLQFDTWHTIYFNITDSKLHMDVWIDGIQRGLNIHTYTDAVQTIRTMMIGNTIAAPPYGVPYGNDPYRFFIDNPQIMYGATNPQIATELIGSVSDQSLSPTDDTILSGELYYPSNNTPLEFRQIGYTGYLPNGTVFRNFHYLQSNQIGLWNNDVIMDDVRSYATTYLSGIVPGGEYYVLMQYPSTDNQVADSNILNLTFNVSATSPISYATLVSGSLSDSSVIWTDNIVANGVFTYPNNGTRIANKNLFFEVHCTSNNTVMESTGFITSGTGTWNYTDIMLDIRNSGWADINGTYYVTVWFEQSGNLNDSNVLNMTLVIGGSSPNPTPSNTMVGWMFILLAALMFPLGLLLRRIQKLKKR